MVRCEDSWSDDVSERSGSQKNGRRTRDASDNEVYGKKSKTSGKYNTIKIQTKALLEKYYCSPVSAIRNIKEFRDNVMLSDPKNRDYLQAAFDDFGKDINDMSLRQIYELLIDKDPIFIQSMVYGTLEDSMNVIDTLLKYQFNDDDEEITKFLIAIVDIVDKRIAKLNCLCVISPPSAGKNFFFDMIFALCQNYGQLGCANKHNVFAFQEAPNKRILLWNEPNYESALTDTIKMMLGGDPYTVRVKNQLDAHVCRTPVIALSNRAVQFMYDLAFQDRIVKFNWRVAPFLKDYNYKPYPMCFFEILNKYNIQFYIKFFIIQVVKRV